MLRDCAVLASLKTRSLLRFNHHQESSLISSSPCPETHSAKNISMGIGKHGHRQLDQGLGHLTARPPRRAERKGADPAAGPWLFSSRQQMRLGAKLSDP